MVAEVNDAFYTEQGKAITCPACWELHYGMCSVAHADLAQKVTELVAAWARASRSVRKNERFKKLFMMTSGSARRRSGVGP